MKHMNPINQSTPTPVLKNTCRGSIDIITSILSSLATPFPHLTTDTIAFPSSYSLIPSTTKIYNQTPSSYSHPPLYLSALPLILQTFLFSDLTSEIPALGKWKKGKRDRVIKSGNRLYLISISEEGSGKEGKWDIYQLPDNRQGGIWKPVLCYTFTSSQIDKLKRMMHCQNISEDGYEYCGYCPRCLSFKSDRKTFVNKSSEIRRLEEIIYDLQEWGKDKGYISSLRDDLLRLQKAGYRQRASILRNRIRRLEEGIAGDPQKQIFYAEQDLEELKQEQRMLKDSAKLASEPHYFISICTPHPLNVLYKAQDVWFKQGVPTPVRRTSSAIRVILKRLEGKEAGFSDMLRCVFRDLVVDAVKEMHPDVKLTMVHQLHPFNKFNMAPDLHFIIRKTVVSARGIRELPFDVLGLKAAIEFKMLIFVEFALLMISKLKLKNIRSKEFEKWLESVEKAGKEIEKAGIPVKAVDIRIRDEQDLLGTHVYVRRYPMENINSLSFNKAKGKVLVKYWERDGGKDKAVLSLIDLLWRFVGFDLRTFGVRKNGDYLSTKSETRGEKMEANKDAKEQCHRARTESMRQEMRRQACNN